MGHEPHVFTIWPVYEQYLAYNKCFLNVCEINKWRLQYLISKSLVLAQSPTKQNLRQSPRAVLLEDIIPEKQDWGKGGNDAGKEERKETQVGVHSFARKCLAGWLIMWALQWVDGTTTSRKSCWTAEGELFICQFLPVSCLTLVKLCPFALSGYVTGPLWAAVGKSETPEVWVG